MPKAGRRVDGGVVRVEKVIKQTRYRLNGENWWVNTKKMRVHKKGEEGG